MLKSYKFRIYPSKAQNNKLCQTLDLCCELYNAALQERRDAFKFTKISLNYHSQAIQLPEIKDSRSEFGNVHSQILQDTLKRLDKAFAAFFRRLKAGDKAGFPRFRSRSRYNSFTFPQFGFAIESSKLKLSKIGKVKIKLHREIEGNIKTCTISQSSTGKWFACLSVECEAKALPVSKENIGIDVGLTTFATLSDGTEIENPRYYRAALAKLRRVQRKVARRKKGSNRRRKAVQLLALIHAHVRNQRADFHHKVSRWIVDNRGLIAVEDLNIKGLARTMLAKSVNDAGWSSFFFMLTYKAEDAGRQLVKGDCRGTSQRCVCGASVPKDLSQRRHSCDSCGLDVGRDHASAMEILRLGLSLQAVT